MKLIINIFLLINSISIFCILLYIIYFRYILTKNKNNVPDHTNKLLKSTITSTHLCPMIPTNLNGRINLNLTEKILVEIENELVSLKIRNGGEYFPLTCFPRHKVAIIVPYRNREKNLLHFLRHMHQFLIKQNIHYGIYIVEPLNNTIFNRGLLMNIGFLESLKRSNDQWDCHIYHDVDLLPEDDRNLYTCPDTPRHMSAAVNKFAYRLPYDSIFGGVSALRKDQMVKVNGYSNCYFGWGGEDDDFRARIVHRGYQIIRYPLEIGRYYMHNHIKDQIDNIHRYDLLKDAEVRMNKEGLNSTKYYLIKFTKYKLYTQILVDYNQKEILKNDCVLL